jgi:hypothetical protein
MAISCDSSGDEYYMTNRVFEFTSESTGKERLVTLMLICFVRFKECNAEEICAVLGGEFRKRRRF